MARTSRGWLDAGLVVALCTSAVAARGAGPACDIPREARDAWRCEQGFVVAGEGLIVRLPIAEVEPEPLYQAGLEAAGRQDWPKAIAYFTAAQQRAHYVPRYMYNLGLAHARAGNELAAVAWLSAYLVADPKAADRAAVWRQIAQLEEKVRQRSATLARAARGAAESLSPDAHPGRAEALARVDGMPALVARRAQAAVEEWDRQLPGGSHFAPAFLDNVWGMYRADLRAGERIGVMDFVQMSARRNGKECTSSAPADPAAVVARARAGRDPAWDRDASIAFILACAGHGAEAVAVAALVADAGNTFETNRAALGPAAPIFRELVAAQVAELLLLKGDAVQAEAAVALADALAAEARSPYSGWAATRARAWLRAEQGQVDEAIELLELQLTRPRFRTNGLDRYGAFSPAQYLTQVRSDAVGSIVEYLVVRGQIDRAIALSARLDSYRREIFAAKAQQLTAYRDARFGQLGNATTTAANEGKFPEHGTRKLVALRAALELEPPAYDVEWWIARALRPDAARGDAFARFELMQRAAEGMAVGVARVRAAYEHSGGRWMDAPPAAPPQPVATTTTTTPGAGTGTGTGGACPANAVAWRGTTTPVKCSCATQVTPGRVWGGPSGYTDDSQLCTAAVHAGMITAREGGTILVTPAPGQASYVGSSSNGVTSDSYASWSGSIRIARAPKR